MKMRKAIALSLAIMILVAASVAGTIAWLTATTGTVTNTFTVGDINIDLKEHALNVETNELNQNVLTESEENYKVLPGTSQPKDPFVTVKANSEDCYVFVQVKEVNNVASTDENGNVTHKYVTWNINGTNWVLLSESGDVKTYYLNGHYETAADDKDYSVLENNQVSYGSALTKKMINAIDADTNGTIEDGEMPKLIFKAFAVQKEAGTDAATAWEAVDSDEKLS